MFDRKKRDELLVETKSVVKEFVSVVTDDLIDDPYYDEDEAALMIRLLRLANNLTDYAEFQAHQLDSIEDTNRRILEEISRIQKEAIQ